MAKVWLITGASTGFGKELALVALARGDKVIATSRSTDRLEHLRAEGAAAVRLDQNESFEHVKAAIQEALNIYGSLDIVVNNAGYVQMGMLEETTSKDDLAQFQANVFGPLNVIRSVLPHMREKRSGTLATVGSMGGWYPTAGCNLYDASKAALRIIGLGLQEEIAGFGLKHCLIEPGYFRTELLNPTANLTRGSNKIDDYNSLNMGLEKAFASAHGAQLGDPVKGAEIIYDVLTSSGVAKGRQIPPFLPLGSDASAQIAKVAREGLDLVKEWEKISGLSDFPPGE